MLLADRLVIRCHSVDERILVEHHLPAGKMSGEPEPTRDCRLGARGHHSARRGRECASSQWMES